jgi:uncharacterized protein YjiS (DUF1127 family)
MRKRMRLRDMSTIFDHVTPWASGITTYLNRRRDRKLLMRLDDRTLADINISRGLLDEGLKAWPWTVPTDENTIRHESGRIRRAIAELRSYSDAELADLGISRGTIVETVLHGRPGIDQPANDDTAGTPAKAA